MRTRSDLVVRGHGGENPVDHCVRAAEVRPGIEYAADLVF